MKINFNTTLYDEKSGTIYKNFQPHFNDYSCLFSDEYDPKTGNFSNFKECILTRQEINRLLKERK